MRDKMQTLWKCAFGIMLLWRTIFKLRQLLRGPIRGSAAGPSSLARRCETQPTAYSRESRRSIKADSASNRFLCRPRRYTKEKRRRRPRPSSIQRMHKISPPSADRSGRNCLLEASSRSSPTFLSLLKLAPRASRASMRRAAWGDKDGKATDNDDDGLLLPKDIESSPRWRWPGSARPPPPPPPPPRSSSSPFDMFGGGPSSSGDRRREGRRQPQRREDWRPSIRQFAGRLFRNPELVKLAQRELAAEAEAEERLAASARQRSGSSPRQQQPRRPPGMPSDAEDITDRRFRDDPDFASWIEYKREQRKRQREDQQVSGPVMPGCRLASQALLNAKL